MRIGRARPDSGLLRGDGATSPRRRFRAQSEGGPIPGPPRREEERAMAVPNASRYWLDIPVVAAPMLLVSGPDPVVETCRGGALGTFPALNQRPYDGHASQLDGIEER